MRNKLKLSLIAIAILVAGNTNAQTYYSCIPEGCPAGQYFDGVKCMKLCPTGYLWDADKTGCYKEYCNISFEKKFFGTCNMKKLTSNTGIQATCKKNSPLSVAKYTATIPYKDCIYGNCCNTKY